jgi:hypothetical protein
MTDVRGQQKAAEAQQRKSDEYLRRAAEQRRREDGAKHAIIAQLHALGVNEATANEAWTAVLLAVGRHARTYDNQTVKGQLEDIIARTNAAVKAVEKASSDAWDHLAAEMTRVIPSAQFVADARQVRDSAREALAKLKRPGKPSTAKAALVDELAIIWSRATGKMPTASGEGSFGAPRSHFGQFVAFAVSAEPGDFKAGFADLLVNAVTRYKKRNPERVAKPSERI